MTEQKVWGTIKRPALPINKPIPSNGLTPIGLLYVLKPWINNLCPDSHGDFSELLSWYYQITAHEYADSL